MVTFSAAAQYDDWIGQAAADDAPNSLFSYLRQEKLMGDGQFPVGLKVYTTDDGYFSGQVLVVEAVNADAAAALIKATEGEIPVQRIELQLTHEQFQKFFKRFSIVLSRPTPSIIDREIPEE